LLVRAVRDAFADAVCRARFVLGAFSAFSPAPVVAARLPLAVCDAGGVFLDDVVTLWSIASRAVRDVQGLGIFTRLGIVEGVLAPRGIRRLAGIRIGFGRSIGDEDVCWREGVRSRLAIDG
jgi:hypothetical protein